MTESEWIKLKKRMFVYENLIPVEVKPKVYYWVRNRCVTNAEFYECIKKHEFKHGTEDEIVDNKTFLEVCKYCNVKSEKEDLDICYNMNSGESFYNSEDYLFHTGWRLPFKDEYLQINKRVSKLDFQLEYTSSVYFKEDPRGFFGFYRKEVVLDSKNMKKPYTRVSLLERLSSVHFRIMKIITEVPHEEINSFERKT